MNILLFIYCFFDFSCPPFCFDSLSFLSYLDVNCCNYCKFRLFQPAEDAQLLIVGSQVGITTRETRFEEAPLGLGVMIVGFQVTKFGWFHCFNKFGLGIVLKSPPVFFSIKNPSISMKREVLIFCSSPSMSSECWSSGNASLRIQSSKRRLVQRGATWFGIGPKLGECHRIAQPKQMCKVILVENSGWCIMVQIKIPEPGALLIFSTYFLKPALGGSFTPVFVPSVLNPPEVYLENEDWPYHAKQNLQSWNAPRFLWMCPEITSSNDATVNIFCWRNWGAPTAPGVLSSIGSPGFGRMLHQKFVFDEKCLRHPNSILLYLFLIYRQYR